MIWDYDSFSSQIIEQFPSRDSLAGARQQECPEILAIQLAGSSEIQERMMLLLKEGRGHHGPPRLDDPDGEIEETSIKFRWKIACLANEITRYEYINQRILR